MGTIYDISVLTEFQHPPLSVLPCSLGVRLKGVLRPGGAQPDGKTAQRAGAQLEKASGPIDGRSLGTSSPPA